MSVKERIKLVRLLKEAQEDAKRIINDITELGATAVKTFDRVTALIDRVENLDKEAEKQIKE